MKTVRFSRVVQTAGEPHVHTLWVQPEKDPEFKRARDAHRVMSVVSHQGKSDVGVVGYDAKEKAAAYLIFPKSLKRFAGARVVGIKFDLVEHPKTVAAKRGDWAHAQGGGKRRPRKTTATVIPFVPSPSPEPEKTETAEETASTGHRRGTAKPSSKSSRSASSHKRPPAGNSALIREVRAALKELEAGKAVAAYHRLQHALP